MDSFLPPPKRNKTNTRRLGWSKIWNDQYMCGGRMRVGSCPHNIDLIDRVNGKDSKGKQTGR
eukprot:scaffold35381_cov260-Amphora_coffeaeformis.AAC.1